MDLLTLVKLMIRRWTVVAVVLVVTAVAGFLVLSNIAPVHSSTGTWVLVPENAAAATAAQSGETSAAEEDLRLQASVVSEIARSPATVQQLRDRGATARYQITQPPTGPLLEVTAFGPDPAEAMRTAQAVIDVITAEAGTRTAAGSPLRATVLSAPLDTRPVESTTDPGAPTFAASGSVLLDNGLASSGTGERGTLNPFIVLERSAVTVVAEYTSTPDFAQAVADRAPGSFQVQAESQAPILRVRTTGPDEAGAEQTLDAVFQTLEAELRIRQEAAGAPEPTWMKLAILAGPNTQTTPGERLPVVMAIALLGALQAVTAVLVVDVIARRRQERRAAEGEAATLEAAPQEEPARATAGTVRDVVDVDH